MKAKCIFFLLFFTSLIGNELPMERGALGELLYHYPLIEAESLGQLSSGEWVLSCSIDEPVYCAHGVYLLEKQDDKWVVLDRIEGYRRSEIRGYKVEGDQVFFWQTASLEALLATAASLFPDFKTYFERSSKEGIGYFTGGFDYVVQVERGKFKEPELLEFVPAEGWSPYSGKEYRGEELKNLAFEFLADLDDDKPEVFKERGIAFSPILFQKLLEEDLKGENLGPKSVKIDTWKNEPVNHYMIPFHWKHIGSFKNHYYVYATLKTGNWSDDSHREFSGIYTIAKEGDTIQKVERLAWSEGKDQFVEGVMEEIILECWFEGFNARDWDAVKSIYSESALVHAKEGRLWGGDAIVKLGKKWVEAIPDAKITPLHTSTEEGTVVVHWRAEGAFTGPINGTSPTGEKVVFHGHTCFRCLDRKVVEHWAAVDYRPLQNGRERETHSVQVILESKNEKQDELKKALLLVAEQSREEGSCLDYRVYQDINNPNQFALHEQWQSQELHQKQFTKPYIIDFSKRAEELLAGPYKAVVGNEIRE